MSKKIGAILLALVLCFSVVVLPASAVGFDGDYTLSTGKTIAFKVELDKATYNPGDTVKVTVYAYADTAKEYNNFSLCFGSNSAVFDQATNTTDAIAKSVQQSSIFVGDAYFQSLASSGQWSWVKSNVIKNFATAAEKELYDQYQKVVFARNTTSGSHPNATNLYQGLSGAEINAEPLMTYSLKLRNDVAPGSVIRIAITEGACTGKVAQVTGKYMANPGTATTTTAIAKTAFDVSQATATATVAAAGPAVAKSKAQVKMTPNSATTVEDAFSFRVTSVITDADWDKYFANSADASATTNAIKSVGFVAYKGTTGFNLDTAKAVAQGTPAAGYDVKTTTYIQKADDASDAYFGCRLEITSAATRSDVTYVAFVEYVDGTGVTQYAFYEAEQTALLNTNYNTIVSTYLAAHPYAG